VTRARGGDGVLVRTAVWTVLLAALGTAGSFGGLMMVLPRESLNPGAGGLALGLTLTSVSAVGSGSGSGSAALTFGSTDGSCFSGTARSGVGVGVSASVPRDFGAGRGHGRGRGPLRQERHLLGHLLGLGLGHVGHRLLGLGEALRLRLRLGILRRRHDRARGQVRGHGRGLGLRRRQLGGVLRERGAVRGRGTRGDVKLGEVRLGPRTEHEGLEASLGLEAGLGQG
jgi:hypothetical protein